MRTSKERNVDVEQKDTSQKSCKEQSSKSFQTAMYRTVSRKFLEVKS